MLIKRLDSKYANTIAVAGMLDATVEMSPLYPAMTEDYDFDNPAAIVPIAQEFLLVQAEDTTAGIFRTEVSPGFPTLDELEEFCAKHLADFEAMMDAEEWPPKLFWEENAA